MDERERQQKNTGRPGPTEETSDEFAEGSIGGNVDGGEKGGSSDVILGPGSAGGDHPRIGPYRILEKLGVGGMGVVYLAEQTAPIHRRVAIKVIKPGMDSKAVIARFEAERQALEKMDHPNIARILDAGVTDRQLPYFVMEYVKGVPITEYADHERLDVEERLELFIQVCEAVQHAHHKGVIHRDLKPSNILVAWEETRPVPKVIDFGVARATDQSGNEAAFTRHGQLIGTPEYMSPEQAEMGAQDIDTRTDVYALGVVLYELLTGVLPFESGTLRQVGIDAVRQIIREVDPPLPSKRLRSLPIDGASTLGTVSKARRTDSKRLARLLRNDLDWVVMKCLEKRRDRRYATPSALALDLRRFISGETVLTGPPSLSYHVGKFVRRHRASVATSALVALALVAGLVASLILLQRARASEAQTRELAVKLITEFHDNVAQLPGAIQARKQFVQLGLEYLDEARASASGNPDLLLDLADAYDKLGDVAAGLRTPHQGNLDDAMERYATARDIRREVEAKRPDDPRVIVGLTHSALAEGDVLRAQEKNADSLQAYRAGLQTLDRLSPDSKGRMDARTERAPLLVTIANGLGRDRETSADPERLGRLEEAERLTMAMVSDEANETTWEARARVLNNLGEYYLEVKRPGAALEPLEQSVSLRAQLYDADRVNGSRRRDLAASLLTLGRTLVALKRAQEGMEKLNESLRHFRFLVEADPTDVEARIRLGQVHEVIGAASPEIGDKVEALRAALEHSTLAVRDAPTPEHKRIRAIHEYALALNLAKARQFEDAATIGASAYVHVAELLREGGDPAPHLALLAKVAQVQGYALQELGKVEGDPPNGSDAPGEVHAAWIQLRRDLDATLDWAMASGALDKTNEGFAASLADLRKWREHCDEALAPSPERE